jgi:hypothetical protein
MPDASSGQAACVPRQTAAAGQTKMTLAHALDRSVPNGYDKTMLIGNGHAPAPLQRDGPPGLAARFMLRASGDDRSCREECDVVAGLRGIVDESMGGMLY